jgi:hypothetical protein
MEDPIRNQFNYTFIRFDRNHLVETFSDTNKRLKIKKLITGIELKSEFVVKRKECLNIFKSYQDEINFPFKVDQL